ncbi:uncharacterized protein DS421_13g423270 [Arachis hypogaea]|nr:uncharacterized protein DS421_13g423270 [Arachis hypogaea]
MLVTPTASSIDGNSSRNDGEWLLHCHSLFLPSLANSISPFSFSNDSGPQQRQ